MSHRGMTVWSCKIKGGRRVWLAWSRLAESGSSACAGSDWEVLTIDIPSLLHYSFTLNRPVFAGLALRATMNIAL